ncbi:ribosome small subunit-dependent GTPase A [Melioribacteraceae bacterium 4301-Me]|uniref:ribosome small subunit-dependent GTPase A n=1 Tax=Pyranulibacter aquaticus TaxID=3163344 RepID=UPI0035965B5A
MYKIESKNYYVVDENGNELRCFLRGKFQKEYNFKKDKLFTLDIAAVGDIVDFEINDSHTGVINHIYERKNYISRKAPRIKGASTRGERLEQIIAANIDQLVIITSVKLPLFNNKALDRLIVIGESSHVDIKIVINKVDLADNNEVNKWFSLYKSIGYNVILTSVVNNVGITELRKTLNGKINLIWGQSGVGKSSILNKLYPFLNFKVGKISDYTYKGKHTTVTSVIRKVEQNTFVIDTPGVREIDPYGIKKEDLGHYFVEFLPYINECKFNTCTHNHEPGCAVYEAVNKNLITKERYESYLNLLDTIEEDLFY